VGLAIGVWLIYRLTSPLRSSAPRRVELLVLGSIPLVHLGYTFLRTTTSAPGPRLLMFPEWTAIRFHAYYFFPDQMVLLCLTVGLAAVALVQAVHKRARPPYEWLDATILLAIGVWGFWAFYFVFHHPLCRYSTAYVLPLVALAGLLTVRVLGTRVSMLVAAAAVLWGLGNQEGWLLPRLRQAGMRSGDSLERSCEFLVDQRAQLQLCRFLEAGPTGRTIIAKYPFLQMLGMPELGYVSRSTGPLMTVARVPSYVPCEAFDPERASRTVTIVYCPSAFEATGMRLVPPIQANILFEDASLPGKLVAYEVPREFVAGTLIASQWRSRGRQHERHDALEEAARCYAKAVESAPHDSEAYRDLGLLALQISPEKSVPILREALKHAPGDATNHHNLGNALAMSGQHDEAIQHYRAALTLEPDLDAARKSLQLLLQEMTKR
jgi:hypothetical protein